MNLLVIHGEDAVASRKSLNVHINAARGKNWEVNISGEKGSLTDVQVSGGSSLFSQKVVWVFVDPDLVKITKTIKGSDHSASSLILYFSKKLAVTSLKSFPKETKVELFDLPKNIYIFLDSFYPGNFKAAINLFHETIRTNPAELIFALLGRQVRDLWWVSVDPASFDAPPWKKVKLAKVAKLFPPASLKSIIKEMAVIDTKVKTSTGDLVLLLDLLMLRYLK